MQLLVHFLCMKFTHGLILLYYNTELTLKQKNTHISNQIKIITLLTTPLIIIVIILHLHLCTITKPHKIKPTSTSIPIRILLLDLCKWIIICICGR